MHSTQHPGDPPEPIPSSHQIPPIPVTSAPSLRWGSTHPPHRQVGGTPMDRSVYPRLYPCCFRERRTERKKERKSHLVTRQTQSPGVLDPSCHTSRIGAATKDIANSNSEVPVRPVPSAIHNNLRLTPYIVSHF